MAEEHDKQFFMVQAKLDTEIEIVSAVPTVGVAVTSKIDYVVPDGCVPVKISSVESKVAHEGKDAVPERMALYVTGRHPEVVVGITVA